MKYCKKCGMLLEDNHERCIRCGADVTLAANVSLYPPEVEKSMKEEKAEKKSKNVMVATLIAIFVVLAILLGLIIWKISSGGMMPQPQTSSTVEEAPAPEEPQTVQIASEPVQEVAETPVDNRDVKDDLGTYFVCKPMTDAGGNHIYNAIYPEDLIQTDFVVDTERYSTVFPELMSFVASDMDNTIRFTYMSPQQLWYQKSEKSRSKSDERDATHYMTFLRFESAQDYITSLVKASYPGTKKIELVNSGEVSSNVTAAVEALSQKRKDFFLSGTMGDYANLGEDTVYATMESTCTAYTYEYQITDSKKDVLYCKFYVPVISNDLYYATDSTGDMGTITEWYILALCGIEAGNDMIYEEYLPAFDIFCANAVPTDEFYFTNAQYQQEIDQSVEAGIEPSPLSESKLSGYASKFTGSDDIGEVRGSIKEFLNSYGAKSFSSDTMTIYAPEGINCAYFDKEANRLFVSTDETEYPGNTYEQLQ